MKMSVVEKATVPATAPTFAKPASGPIPTAPSPQLGLTTPEAPVPTGVMGFFESGVAGIGSKLLKFMSCSRLLCASAFRCENTLCFLARTGFSCAGARGWWYSGDSTMTGSEEAVLVDVAEDGVFSEGSR
jgi:hypothetical protein